MKQGETYTATLTVGGVERVLWRDAWGWHQYTVPLVAEGYADLVVTYSNGMTRRATITAGSVISLHDDGLTIAGPEGLPKQHLSREDRRDL